MNNLLTVIVMPTLGCDIVLTVTDEDADGRGLTSVSAIYVLVKQLPFIEVRSGTTRIPRGN
jgi:hypothetical protein